MSLSIAKRDRELVKARVKVRRLKERNVRLWSYVEALEALVTASADLRRPEWKSVIRRRKALLRGREAA